MSYPLYLLDVFSEMKYAGNQLAVVRNAAGLSPTVMQKIAREMNYSETTFILSDRESNGGYDVRIFSLDEELPFAGHPTLGSAFVIQQFIIGNEAEEVKLNLEVGQIPVTFTYVEGKPDVLWMKQIAPVFGVEFEATLVAAALNIDEAMIDRRFPIQEVSTGLPFIIVPLKNLDAVKACQIDRVGYLKLVDRANAKSIFVFCPETYQQANQLNARMFDDYHGIAEDPATGSANGCLAAYLVKHRFFGTAQIDLRVEQGYEIGRPSLLMLKAAEHGVGQISVEVGGKVYLVAIGDLV
jgi:trans-2,3-dihydro-3-hydroxyanthranilate isomerase